VKKRILVVDDEKDNAGVFSMALEDTGLYEVDSFTNPISALSSFKSNTYNLAILDIRMPKMNGYELYEKIKNIDHKIKVCFLTAFGEGYHEEFKRRFQGGQEEDKSSAPDDVYFLRKPITLEELVEQVNEII
jgi:two-component system, OmpR family, response regulator ChvI